MKLFAKRHKTSAARNADKYDNPMAGRRGQSSVAEAVVESVLNPFFVLGSR